MGNLLAIAIGSAFISNVVLSQFLGISRAGTYELFHCESFPCIRINKRMLVERDKLLAWLDEQSRR